MSILKKARAQTCVYWGKPINTGIDTKFPLPVECKCRWDDDQVLVRTDKNEEYLSDATVLLDKITVIGGFLWLGTLTELQSRFGTGIDDPINIPGAKEIKHTETMPMLGIKNLTNMNRVAHFAYC